MATVGKDDHMGKATPEQRFWKYTQKTDSCWEWVGATTNTGYGVMGNGAGRTVCAHRFSHELHIGPIPEGWQVDHLCFNRTCVNPAHLEAVTPVENYQRKKGASRNNVSSGVRNVRPNGNRWAVIIRYEKKGYYLGTFDTVPEAESVAIAGRASLERGEIPAAVRVRRGRRPVVA